MSAYDAVVLAVLVLVAVLCFTRREGEPWN
jgi:hypothetical protein